MVKPNLDNWKLNLEDIHWIENALGYRLQRLAMKRLTVKKQSSKDNIDKDYFKEYIKNKTKKVLKKIKKLKQHG